MLFLKNEPYKSNCAVGKESYHSSAASAAACELGYGFCLGFTAYRTGIGLNALLFLGGLLGYCSAVPYVA